MASKPVTIKVESDLLEKFDEFAKEIGSNRSGVLNMLMTYCVKNQKLPELSARKGYDFGHEM